MIIPVRCFCCGKVIANKWKKFEELLKKKNTKKDALNKLGLRRYCCRRMFLSHVSLIDKVIQYKNNFT